MGNMKNTGVNVIESLKVSEGAKEVLRRIYKVASSENVYVKETVKNIFVTCPEGAGLSEYARAYEKIIIENEVYRVKGKCTYLELAFPRIGGELEYRKFFDSPRLVAATINNFVGVFLISFEQWSGYSELMREKYFKELLQFIDDNKNNISFVFHVMPEFSEKDRLVDLLNSHVNILKVDLKKPDAQEATEYIKDELKNMNIKFDSCAKKSLEEFILTNVDIESKAYVGYSTLDRLAKDVSFEIFCKLEANEDGMMFVDKMIMTELLDDIKFTLNGYETQVKFGFS